MTSVFVGGRALISALGADLNAALAHLSKGGRPFTKWSDFGESGRWPYYAIAGERVDWRADMFRLVQQAICEADAEHRRDAPLYVASSQLDIGALENGQNAGDDFLDFARDIAKHLHWRGPVFLISSACTSSTNALLSAAAAIARGEYDQAVILGVEMGSRYTVGGFGGMQLLSSTRAMPLGAERDGLVLGEAICAVVLSRAPTRWKFLGGANVTSGADATGADRLAVEAMYAQALDACMLTPQDIDIIKLQAAGSPTNDEIELLAASRVFGDRPALISLKPHLGHTLGASGAAELALCTACLESRVWPASDYAMDASLPRQLSTQMPARARYSLHTVLGFGGGHASVILEDCSFAS